MRALVCGGRNFGTREDEFYFIYDCLSSYLTYDKYDHIIVINGAAAGVDSISSQWAREREIPVVEYPAEWYKYGKAAGYYRNTKMLKEAKPDVILAFPGGKGQK